MRTQVVPARTGVWIAVLTISMSFAAITSAMIARAGGALDWERIRLPPILYVNTLLLMLSSWTLESARARLPGDARSRTIGGSAAHWLALTLALGLMFIAGQLVAWRALAAQGLFLATSPTSSFFYVFTALHAVHLAGGVVALAFALYRVRTGTPTPAVAGTTLGAVAVYWHFMTALWLYLLLLMTIRL